VADKPHILIVEDDLDLAEMLTAYFKVQGYDVFTANWGEDAVRVSREQALSLIVLDIRLPDIDGYEVCKRIRANRKTQDTPIIFLTEKRDRVDKLAGLELGVVDYITKPFDIQELRLRIRNALRRTEQSSVINSVTNLPEIPVVEDKLRDLLVNDAKGWAILKISINGLEEFREHYGFVASDDVLRAVTLMINNAIRKAGAESDFLGHLAANEFALITDTARAKPIQDEIEQRIKQSMEYFYPLKDREKAKQALAEQRLQLSVASFNGDAKAFNDPAAFREAIQKI